MFRYEMDEDGNWYKDTNGRCLNCGEYVEIRIKYYGQWICKRCYEEAEGEEDE